MYRQASSVRRPSCISLMVERTSREKEAEPMSFAESILTEVLKPLRQRLLFHPPLGRDRAGPAFARDPARLGPA
jgi:hypothetical protein